MTVRDLLIDALIEINVIASADDLEPDEEALALRHLRRMRDAFLANRLTLYTVDRQSFALIPNQQSYTIGPSGNFVTANRARPLFIGNMGVIPAGDTTELDVVPYTRGEWLRERLKSLKDLYPKRYEYEPTDTNGTLTFWPIPTSAAHVILGSPVPLQALSANDVTALATTVTFPEGYEDCWVKNLAARLQRPFAKPTDATLMDDAQKALSVIEKLNDEGPSLASCDPAILGTAGGGYDIYSNRIRR